MKATVNLEFSDREIEDLAAKLLVRTIGSTIGSPSFSKGFSQGARLVLNGLGIRLGDVPSANAVPAPATSETGPVPGVDVPPHPSPGASEAIIARWMRRYSGAWSAAHPMPTPDAPDSALAAWYRTFTSAWFGAPAHADRPTHAPPPPPIDAPDSVIADWLRAQSPPPPPVPDAALAAMYRAQAGVGAGLRPGADGCGPDAG